MGFLAGTRKELAHAAFAKKSFDELLDLMAEVSFQ